MFRLVSMEPFHTDLLKMYCVQLTMFCLVRDLVLYFLKYIMNYVKNDSNMQLISRLKITGNKMK